MTERRMKYAALVAILALSLLACTALQGLFGEDTANLGSENSGPASGDGAGGSAFVEDFSGTLSGWRDYILGEGQDADTSIVDGKFLFDIQSEYTYAYTIYEAETYTDVALIANVENRGDPDNYITLVCRYSSDGWYEFNVASDGLWAVFAYNSSTQGLLPLDNGTSEAINLGLASNELSATCQGNQLSLSINGELTSSVTDDTFAEGYIGISVASFGNLPVQVLFDSLQVLLP